LFKRYDVAHIFKSKMIGGAGPMEAEIFRGARMKEVLPQGRAPSSENAKEVD
jgi:hypothetical protein